MAWYDTLNTAARKEIVIQAKSAVLAHSKQLGCVQVNTIVDITPAIAKELLKRQYFGVSGSLAATISDGGAHIRECLQECIREAKLARTERVFKQNYYEVENFIGEHRRGAVVIIDNSKDEYPF